MKVSKNMRKYLFKYLLIYRWYFFCILFAFVIVYFTEVCMLNITADFEAPVEYPFEDAETNSIRVVYNYFFDFSPSMQGFLYEDINTDMRKVAEAFEQINALNADNRFYWCRDTIYTVNAASDFYESMKSDDILDQYYGGIIRNGALAGDSDGEETEEDNEIDSVIKNINLSNIFISSNVITTEADLDSVNIIITDLNFLKNSTDLEDHNSLLENFALRLGQSAANANICIYAINSIYAGAGYDVYDGERGRGTIDAPFYVIVFSDSEGKYKEYCHRFESALEQVQKFELQNHINGDTPLLEGDLSKFHALNQEITKENLNYANGLFDELDQNELALQLVTADSSTATLSAPIAEVNFSGYNTPEELGFDKSIISMEIELYRNNKNRLFGKNNYELYEDSSMIKETTAGMYYAVNRWFLRINMIFSTQPNVPQPNGLYQSLLEKIRRNYIVMNLKFYMERPAFSKPEWVSTIGFPYINSDEIHDIETVIDKIIDYKQQAYTTQPPADRYLGNKIIYLFY